MQSYNLAPLYRSTVGFDQMLSVLSRVGSGEALPGYPPYDIARTGENSYRISVAVAGFTDADLSIVAKDDTVTIRGDKQVTEKELPEEILYQGIAARAFERTFQLADYVAVTTASLENGLLKVGLMRDVPDTKKSRVIPISGAGKLAGEAPAVLAA